MKVNIGDHVELKGWGLRGFTGTIVDRTWIGSLIVALDPPQLRGGNNRLTVRKIHIKRNWKQYVPITNPGDFTHVS